MSTAGSRANSRRRTRGLRTGTGSFVFGAYAAVAHSEAESGGRLALERCGVATWHFVRRHVLEVVADVPPAAKRVPETTPSLAIEPRFAKRSSFTTWPHDAADPRRGLKESDRRRARGARTVARPGGTPQCHAGKLPGTPARSARSEERRVGKE